MTKVKINDELFTQIVTESTSIRQVLIKGGWSPTGGGAYDQIQTRINRLKLDISHFLGQGHSKGKTIATRDTWRKLDEYLVLDGPAISAHILKKKLIKAAIKKHQCEKCYTTEWCNLPIPIELDHVNGNRYDNRLENLRILCPNCHAQTDTYCGKNIKNRPVYPCSVCGIPKKNKYRLTCGDLSCLQKLKGQYKRIQPEPRGRPIKIIWPTKNELEILVWKVPTFTLAKQLGVSDSAIGKKCKQLNIKKPPRGYWAKLYANR